MSGLESRLCILYLEDNPRDEELVKHTLKQAGLACELKHVDTAERLLVTLREVLTAF